MAIIKPPYGARASGKLANAVFTHVKGGAQVLRAFSIGTNPQTAAQSAVRANLSGFAALWRALSGPNKLAWDNAGALSLRVNALGDPVPLSGEQMYISVNRNLSTAGVPAIDTPLAPVGSEAVLSVAVVADSGAGSVIVTVDPDPVPADHTMIFQATLPVSAGKTNLNNLYRQIGSEVATTAGPFDMSAEWVAKYGSLISGMKIGVRVYMIRTDTGEVSVAVSDQTITI